MCSSNNKPLTFTFKVNYLKGHGVHALKSAYLTTLKEVILLRTHTHTRDNCQWEQNLTLIFKIKSHGHSAKAPESSYLAKNYWS